MATERTLGAKTEDNKYNIKEGDITIEFLEMLINKHKERKLDDWIYSNIAKMFLYLYAKGNINIQYDITNSSIIDSRLSNKVNGRKTDFEAPSTSEGSQTIINNTNTRSETDVINNYTVEDCLFLGYYIYNQYFDNRDN